MDWNLLPHSYLRGVSSICFLLFYLLSSSSLIPRHQEKMSLLSVRAFSVSWHLLFCLVHGCYLLVFLVSLQFYIHWSFLTSWLEVDPFQVTPHDVSLSYWPLLSCKWFVCMYALISLNTHLTLYLFPCITMSFHEGRSLSPEPWMCLVWCMVGIYETISLFLYLLNFKKDIFKWKKLRKTESALGVTSHRLTILGSLQFWPKWPEQ
jgi:hypothetical protein